ncbi:ASKHA domain-containing protein [Anaerococcus obesiensis]|uniref:ASKHA domain-containing protein n=1 Tax=Anaerococcus obesiensis TaxID=1287640 RepID=UPI0002D7E2DF|nr:ASKHA domain-containing protein [Anaerococcus obesiensis]
MKIEIENLNKIIDSKGKNILESLLANNIKIDNFCNGKGTCGKCKIKILKGELNPISLSEKSSLTDDEIKNGIRLACLTFPKSDLRIKTINNDLDFKILDYGEIPDFEMKFDKGFGLALDIGTTSLAMYLVDLSNGKIIDKISSINSQVKYGLDVMTRISFEYENENGKNLLQDEIIISINNLIDELVNKNEIERSQIKKLVIGANTTMLHMLVGVDAKSLGKFPYKAKFLNSLKINSKDLGLNIPAKVYTLPNISAFVGSDVVAGIFLTDLKNQKNTLFIDIGTNGEIVLKTKDKLYATSTAAGPALEGMNISCGMRAESGAIDSVKIQDENINFSTIYKKKPRGICGSGLLSLVSQIIEKDFVNKRGRILDPKKLDKEDYRRKFIKEDSKRKRIIILDSKENIYISQKDIRQVQLAKGAILSGFLILLEKENIEIEDLNSVIIAGGFGSHLKKEDLTEVGILPKKVEEKIRYVGNSSLIGAYMALMNENIIRKMEELSQNITYLDLATSENYERKFAKAMQF